MKKKQITADENAKIWGIETDKSTRPIEIGPGCDGLQYYPSGEIMNRNTCNVKPYNWSLEPQNTTHRRYSESEIEHYTALHNSNIEAQQGQEEQEFVQPVPYAAPLPLEIISIKSQQFIEYAKLEEIPKEQIILTLARIDGIANYYMDTICRCVALKLYGEDPTEAEIKAHKEKKTAQQQKNKPPSLGSLLYQKFFFFLSC